MRRSCLDECGRSGAGGLDGSWGEGDEGAEVTSGGEEGTGREVPWERSVWRFTSGVEVVDAPDDYNIELVATPGKNGGWEKTYSTVSSLPARPTMTSALIVAIIRLLRTFSLLPIRLARRIIDRQLHTPI